MPAKPPIPCASPVVPQVLFNNAGSVGDLSQKVADIADLDPPGIGNRARRHDLTTLSSLCCSRPWLNRSCRQHCVNIVQKNKRAHLRPLENRRGPVLLKLAQRWDPIRHIGVVHGVVLLCARKLN